MGYALSGKTALVTGANRGIGEAIVDALVAAGVKKVYAAARNISTPDPPLDPPGPALAPPPAPRVRPRRAAPARCAQRGADRNRRRHRDGRRSPGQQRGHRRLLW